MEMKTRFKNKEEVKEYDQEGGEFMLLQDVSFVPSEKEEVLMIFKFATAHEYRAIQLSPEIFDRLRKRTITFYDLYESEFLTKRNPD